MEKENNYSIISCKDKNGLKAYQGSFIKNELPKELALLEWFHLKNPVKEMFIDFAVPMNNEAEIAAIYAVFPIYFTIMGKKVKATQSIDTLTDLQHRGKGLFNQLAKSVYQKSINENYSLVYGFPNDQSASGFFKKLEWKSLGTAPFLIKPLRTKYFIKQKVKSLFIQKLLPNIPLSISKKVKFLKGNTIVNIEKFDEPFTALWQSFTQGKIIGITRDADYLNWRFKEKPFEEYICKGFYAENELKGFVVYCVKEKHEGKIGYIMELIYDLNSPSVGKDLLQFACNEITKKGADVILAWNLNHSTNHPVFKKLHFWGLPEKLRPIKLFFGVRSYDVSMDVDLYNSKNWYLSYCDSDTV